ncbi:MAG TPA: hypothetical protein VGG56_12290 [Terracidiphilus sp.]
MKNLPFIVAIGFIVFCVGGLARVYMDFSSKNGRFWGGNSAQKNTELSYIRMAKETGKSQWPVYLAAICIPLGIAIVFGAILYHNHLRLK